jgi:hypothetical protein
MTDHKQLENVEYFNCLGSMITNDARCTREIKSWIVMEKAVFIRKKTLFTCKLDSNVRKKLVKCCILMLAEQKYLESFEMWCWRRMKKISWTDGVRSEGVLHKVKEERNIIHRVKRREG